MTTLEMSLSVFSSVSLVLVAFSYFGYPAVMIWRARHAAARRIASDGPAPTSVTIVLAVYNEQRRVASRVMELQDLASGLHVASDLIVIDDGSNDGTLEEVRRVASPATRVIRIERNAGKASAINEAMRHARGEVVVLADVRQSWNGSTLANLIAPFRDADVGAVSGRLALAAEGATAGVGLYWRLESHLRAAEAALGSCIGVTGSICAVKRQLFQPIPAGTILDDVYWPMHVVKSGKRVVMAPDAIATDSLPSRSSQEFQRKVRTLTGNYQLLSLAPWLLSPVSNPVWGRFVAHKLMRLAAPWGTLACMACWFVLYDMLFFRVAFLASLALVAIGIIGLVAPKWDGPRLVKICSAFMILNAAAIVALWTWLFGREAGVWRKIDYSSR